MHLSAPPPPLLPQVHFDLLQQSLEELKETRQDVVRRSAEAGVQRGESQKRKEESSAAIREQLGLRSHVNQLMGQLEELRLQHQAAGSC